MKKFGEKYPIWEAGDFSIMILNEVDKGGTRATLKKH